MGNPLNLKIAERVEQGIECQLCGQYIGPPTGYVRSCLECNPTQKTYPAKKLRRSGSKHAERSQNPELL